MNLVVMTNNRCNLDCGYCMMRLNQDDALFLSPDAVERGVAKFAGDAARRPSLVIYTGGEPTLRMPELQDVVRRVSAGNPSLRQAVVTNGLALTPEALEFFSARKVRVFISLDGDEASTDLERKSYGEADRPVWRRIVERLEGASLRGLGANMVVTPETAARLVDNVEFLRARGFGAIDSRPDLLELSRVSRWDEKAIGRLREAGLRLSRYLEETYVAGRLDFEFNLMADVWSHAQGQGKAETLVLGADGGFYPGASIFKRPYDQLAAFRVGDVSKGVDWARLDSWSAEAGAALAAPLRNSPPYIRPLDAYLYARLNGTPPVELMTRTLKVYDALAAPLLDLLRRRPDIARSSRDEAPGKPRPKA